LLIALGLCWALSSPLAGAGASGPVMDTRNAAKAHSHPLEQVRKHRQRGDPEDEEMEESSLTTKGGAALLGSSLGAGGSVLAGGVLGLIVGGIMGGCCAATGLMACESAFAGPALAIAAAFIGGGVFLSAGTLASGLVGSLSAWSASGRFGRRLPLWASLGPAVLVSFFSFAVSVGVAIPFLLGGAYYVSASYDSEVLARTKGKASKFSADSYLGAAKNQAMVGGGLLLAGGVMFVATQLLGLAATIAASTGGGILGAYLNKDEAPPPPRRTREDDNAVIPARPSRDQPTEFISPDEESAPVERAPPTPATPEDPVPDAPAY
jgi:hypothetical protein